MLNSILQQTVPLMYYLHTIKYSVYKMLKSFRKFDKTSGFPADYSTHVVPYKELNNLYLKASTSGIFTTCSD